MPPALSGNLLGLLLAVLVIAGSGMIFVRSAKKAQTLNQEIRQLAKESVELQRRTNELLRVIHASLESRNGQG